METLAWFLRPSSAPVAQLQDEVWLVTAQAFRRSHRQAQLRWMVMPLVGVFSLLFIIVRPSIALALSRHSLDSVDRQLLELEQELNLDDDFYISENQFLEGGV